MTTITFKIFMRFDKQATPKMSEKEKEKERERESIRPQKLAKKPGLKVIIIQLNILYSMRHPANAYTSLPRPTYHFSFS